MATTYTFRFTDGTKSTFQVAPFTANGPADPGSLIFMPQAIAAHTVLKLYGQGMPDYGEGIEQNLIYMLENFANSTAPVRSIEGQHWFNNTTGELFLYDGSTWGATILASGISPMAANLNMGIGSPFTNRIINLADPINTQDAVTLSYADSNYLNSSGDTIDGDLIVNGDITATGDVIISIGSPVNPSGAINKSYADNTYLSLTGGTMTGTIILPPGDPANGLGAVSRDFGDSRYVNIIGDTMTGVLVLSADPLNPFEAATKQYVDTAVAIAGDGVLTSINFISSPAGSPPVAVTANADTMVFVRSGGLPDIQVVGLDYAGKLKPASEISLVPPGGDITATDVQFGFDQIENSKLSINGGVMAGTLDMLLNNIENVPTPITANQAANKAYVDNAKSPDILNNIFLTDGISTTYDSPGHLGGDNKLQVYVNGQKKYADTYGYTEISYSRTLGKILSTSLTNIDTSITDYNFDIQIDGSVGSPVYNIALPVSSGSPPTTIGVDTHQGLLNTINSLITLFGVSPIPTMTFVNQNNAERINSQTQGSTSDIIISNSSTGTYLFDIPSPIPIIAISDGTGSPIGSPIISSFTVSGDQTATFTSGKTFTVLNTTTDLSGQPTIDGVYTTAYSTFSGSPGLTTIVLDTVLNIFGNIIDTGEISLTHISGLISISDIAGATYDYSEVNGAGTDVNKGGLTTQIKFKTIFATIEQVEMILFG